MTTCKNCGKEIYQERDGTWYHTEDDYEICNANKAINPARFFDVASPIPEVSPKEKLYQETLDEIAQKIQSGEVNNKPRYWLNWGELTTVRRNMRVGELKYFTNLEIEEAVKLAIEKTYSALQSGKLTEVGQSLYTTDGSTLKLIQQSSYLPSLNLNCKYYFQTILVVYIK